MEYFIKVYQPKEWPVVEVLITQDQCQYTPYLGAKATIGFPTDSTVAPVTLIGTTSLPYPLNLEQAKEFRRWLDLAISAMQCLEIIQTPDDLRRPIWAKIEGDTVVVGFKDAQEL